MSGAWPLLGIDATPAGWEVRRIGDLVDLTNGYPFDSETFGPEGDLPLVRIRDLFLDEPTTFVQGEVPDTVVLRDGDVVIGMDGAFELVVWQRGPAALNQRMCLLRPRPGVDARFVAYSLPRHLRVLNDLTYATTVKHLSSYDVLAERIACPSFGEQRAIADYLDAEVARIDRMRALIVIRQELLDERIRVVVRHDLLQSGSRTGPLRRFATRVKTGATPPNSDEGEVPWYTPASYRDGLALGAPVRSVPASWIAVGFAVRFAPGSSLIVGIGATVGRVAHLDHEASGNQQLTSVEPGTQLLPRFLSWQLWARADELRGTASATTLPIISNEVVRSFCLTVPGLDEQARLTERWERDARTARALSHATWTLDALLLERRQALITAAVTGQLEIPGVAA